MGGEPTFVAGRSAGAGMDGGPDGGRKRELAGLLAAQLAEAFAAGA